ncbi:Uncharacterised protein [Mycobacteroides abscessus subsp. abscessus]|nr:Uncharacterised protein [Mycobacteroides abscessus subsp. abscessus]SIH31538.1 Uncharacterised protein [Mycobacteroides abscessus subsp. abscessus]
MKGLGGSVGKDLALARMIPELTADGHLPPGRYRVTLEAIRDRFVAHEDFAGSSSRARLFGGLVEYLIAWEDVQAMTSANGRILKSLWLAGSFTSSVVDPRDVDATPIVNGVVADSVVGRPGSKGIKRLIQHRDSIKARYGVEIFPVRWHPIEHPFDPKVDLTGDEAAYLSDRGKMDDWWQRCRVNGEDAPTAASCETRRGYLEVIA